MNSLMLNVQCSMLNDPGESSPRASHLGARQGDGEARTKLYKASTAKEHRSRQRRSVPRAASAAGSAGWQGGGVEGVG